MNQLNTVFLDQSKQMLRNSLRSLRRQVTNRQLIDLLADMNVAGALELHEMGHVGAILVCDGCRVVC
jgi:hypothetical protein